MIDLEEAFRGGREGRSTERVAVLVLTAVAAGLRWRLLGQPIRYDEAVTWLRYVSEPLATALSLYDLPNNHLFHTLLAHASTGLLGDGPRALRLPAFLAGTALVPATWWLGRAAAGPGAALVAAASVAVSPVLVLFSANGRGYGLVVLAFVVLARLALALRRRSTPGRLAAFAGAAALAGWTMPAALYPAVAAGAWLVAPAAPGETVRPLGARARSLAAGALAAAAAAALLYAPVLRRSGLESVVANRFVAPRGTAEAAAGLPGFLGEVAVQWAHGVPAGLWGLLALGAVAAAASEVRRWIAGREADRPPRLFPVALAASAALLLVHGRVPFARVWLYLLPAFAIFAADGLLRAAGRLVDGPVRPGAPAVARGVLTAVSAAAVLGVGAAGLVGAEPVRSWGLTGTLPQGDRVARYLAPRLAPGDAVRAPLPSDAPLEYYFRRFDVSPRTVNGSPAADGCVYLVVNRRRGQTPEGVLGPAADAGTPRLLRRFGPTEVHVSPPRLRSRGGRPCAGTGGPAGEPPASTGTRRERRGGRLDEPAAG